MKRSHPWSQNPVWTGHVRGGDVPGLQQKMGGGLMSKSEANMNKKHAVVKFQDCLVGLGQKQFADCITSLFRGDEDWFNRMCGITAQRSSVLSSSPSPKP